MRVGEAKQRDIGKKRARIGPDAMDYLQVTPGDVIQINSKKSTCAIVWPTDEDEKYPDTIRVDGQTRKNLGVALSDVVEIKKIITKPAKSAIQSCPVPNKKLKSNCTLISATIKENA